MEVLLAVKNWELINVAWRLVELGDKIFLLGVQEVGS